MTGPVERNRSAAQQHLHCQAEVKLRGYIETGKNGTEGLTSSREKKPKETMRKDPEKHKRIYHHLARERS
jgi:hypothetical protein